MMIKFIYTTCLANKEVRSYVLVWRSQPEREDLVTAQSCTCTMLPKTGASNQIVVFLIKRFL